MPSQKLRPVQKSAPGQSVPKGYCLDIVTIVLCFSSIRMLNSIKSRVGYIVKVAFIVALRIYEFLSFLYGAWGTSEDAMRFSVSHLGLRCSYMFPF